MRGSKRHLAAALALLSVLAGCAHERIAWPPKPAEVAEISMAAYDDFYLRVEFVDPIAARRELGDELHLKGIVWLDDQQIIFRKRDDQLLPVPADQVRGLTVKDRGRGALVGGLIGAGSGALAFFGTWYLFGVVGDDHAFTSPSCPASCAAKGIAGAVGGTALAGMAIGYMISGRRSYEFVPAR